MPIRLLSEQPNHRWYDFDDRLEPRSKQNFPEVLPGAVRQFAIVATPRSGSTLLCGLLNSHPDVVCHLEALHPGHVDVELAGEWVYLKNAELRDYDQIRFTRELITHTVNENPKAKAVGFKVLLSPPQMKAGYVYVMADLGCFKILLDRPNRFEGYRSWKNSMLSGQWRVTDDETPRQVPLVFDRAEFLTYVADHDAFMADTRKRLSHLRRFHGWPEPLELTYDDVVHGDGAQRALRHLGIMDGSALSSHWRPMNPTPAIGAFSNAADAEAALREIGHLDWLQ